MILTRFGNGDNYRADIDSDKAQKSVGGGLCMFVSDSWATQYCVREQVCTRDFELLTVSFRPCYLPREFGQITVILVYVPGPDFKMAAERITVSTRRFRGRSTNLFLFWVTLIPVTYPPTFPPSSSTSPVQPV